MTDQTAARLASLGVATLHEVGGRRNVVIGIRLLVGAPFAGPAVTVALPAGDNLGVHLAIEAASPGSVVCIASCGRGGYGVLGELLLEAARARDVTGIVIDDSIRDLDALDAPPGVAARGTNPRGTIKRRIRQAVGSPVSIGDTLVCQGDWVVADHDGICVVAAGKDTDIDAAAQVRVAEQQARGEIARGVSTREVFHLPRSATTSLR